MQVPRYVGFKTLSFLLIVVAFGGCADSSFVDSESFQEVAEPASPYTKLRHDHLLRAKFLSRAKVLERYAELSVSNDFILGMNRVLERYKVIERYQDLPGIKIKGRYSKTIDGFAVRIDGRLMTIEEFLALVEADPDIEWIEPDIKFKSRDGKVIKEDGMAGQYVPPTLYDIGAEASWTLPGDGFGSVDGVEVYVMDTGLEHDELNVVEAVNFADDEMVADAMWQHGTHVAGTIAAIDDADGLVGVAPGARIHSLRVLNSRGEADLSAAISAVEYVTAQKAASPSTPMVVNISFGGDIGTTAYNALDYAIQASIATGVTYVIAAGNDAIDVSTVTPAHVNEAITVGAIATSPSGRLEYSTFSNFGNGIDVTAPGENVKSLAFGSLGYIKMDGTSMAAPHVTGAAALYLSKNPSATPDDVVWAIYEATRNDVSNVPSATTKWRLALDLYPFGFEYFSNAGGSSTSGRGGKGGGKGK